jgi:uncharacterized membrane protein YccC
MVRAAIEWGSLRSQVREHRAQLALALRVTVAAVAAFASSNLLDVPLPLWTVLTAVILTQVTFGRSVKATIDYLLGTIGGAIYAGAIAVLVPHPNDFALAGALALSVAPLALLGSIYPNFAAATFTGVLVLLIPRIAHVDPIHSALYRVLEVGVGGLTALAVSLLVFPARAHLFAIDAAARTLDLMAGFLPELFAGFFQARDTSAVRRMQGDIGRLVAQTEMVAGEARHERIGFLGAELDQGPLLRTLLRLRHDLVMMGRAGGEPLPDALQARLEPRLARIEEAVAARLRQSGEALTDRREPSPPTAAEAAFGDFAETFAMVRVEGLTRNLPVDEVERLFTLGFALDQMRQNMRDLDRCVSEWALGR